ncbi:hypothetical protein [Candidatus Nanohalobium constans]|nr:hypothetical protein [Candidatus Nanohalobium constans]
MVETALEITCDSCSNRFWYSGEKKYPETVECSKCSKENKIPEEG